MNYCQESFVNTALEILEQTLDSQNAEGDSVKVLLGINATDVREVIVFLTYFLPDKIYLERFRTVKEYFQFILIKQLILFMAQEDITSKNFRSHLLKFKDILLHELDNVYVKESL